MELSNKKRFNVDSPSFTPSLPSGNGAPTPKKSTAMSPKAASAAPFQPRTASRMASPTPREWPPLIDQGSNTSTPTGRQEIATPDWATVAEVQEFVPQGFDGSHVVSASCSFCVGGIFPKVFTHGPPPPSPRSFAS